MFCIKSRFFVYLFFFLSPLLIGQTSTIDSLLFLAEQEQDDLQKLIVYKQAIDELVDEAPEKAIDIYKKQEALLATNISLYTDAMSKIAYGYGQLRAYEKGHALLDKCLEMTNDSSTYYYATYIRGKLLHKERKFLEAVQPFQLAHSYYENTDTTLFKKTQKSLVYGYLLLNHQYQLNNRDSARLFLLAGEAITNKQYFPDSNSIVLLFTLGATYTREYDTLRGFKHLDHADRLATGYYELIAQNVHFEKGLVYGKLGLLDQAMAAHQHSLALAKKTNYSHNIFGNMLAIGHLFRELKVYEKAIQYFQDCQEYAQKIENDVFTNLALSGLAQTHTQMQDYKTALAIHQQLLTINDSLKNNYQIIMNNNNIAHIKNIQEQLVEAQQHNNKAYTMAKKLGFKEQLAHSAYLAAELAYKQGNAKEAILKLQETIDLQAYNSKMQMVDAYKNMATYYEATGNHKEALTNYKLFNIEKDSLFSLEKTKAFAEMESRFQNEKIKKENEFLKLEKTQKDTILQQRTWLLLAIGTGLLLLGMLVLALFQKNKQKQLINQLLEKEIVSKDDKLQQTNKQLKKTATELVSMGEKLDTKNYELTSKTATLHSYTKKIEHIDENISKIILETDATTKRKLQQLKKKLQVTHPSEESSLSEFHQLLTNHDAHFFQQLISQHPNLTKNDLNHCAFIRLTMSLKEVAELMNITENSVKKARYRLKKKIDLPLDIDLKKYLIGL